MKKIVRLFFIIPLLFLLMIVITSCGSYDFKYWNECESLNSLKSYVEDVTNEKSDNFIPKEDRIVIFDMDGTLYGELFPVYFEYLLYCHRVLDDSTYTGATDEMIATANLIRTNKYTWNMKESNIPLDHARGQAKAFAGMTEDEFIDYVKEFAKK